MAPLPAAAAAPAFLFLSPPGKLPGGKPRLKPSCAASTSSSSSSSSSSPSLAEQLEPLSRRLLHGKPTPTQHAPEPTWVNPSKPKPTVLSLRRHRRRSPSSHPSSAPLQPLLRAIRALPDAADLAPTLHDFFPPPSPPSTSDALLLLNYLHPSWRKSLSLLCWLRALPDGAFPLDTIVFNVALKSLRAARQWPQAERLALDMLASGVPLDNITYSTLITAARRCRQFDKAVEWFERMYASDGVLPDEVTYSAILDVYAQLGMKEEVLALFDRARGSGWKPDHVAFAVLAKMFGEAGDYDGIQFVFKEMREVGIKPNIFVYNALLEALGKTGKPGLARSLFEEMTAEGVEPNARTLTALAKIYGRARWGRDALQLWEQMREKKLPADNILCNTLLSMCADVGLVGEAEQLFSEMKDPDLGDVPKPDKWSYTAMINIYGSSGDADRALQLFAEMVESGIEPNIMSYTIVIQCLGKAGRIQEAVDVLEAGMAKGLKPDDRLCGCLLSVVALSSGDETEVILACLEKVRSNLVKLIRMLGDARVGVEDLRVELKGILNSAAPEVRRPYCNCLIDICRNHGYPSERAVELFCLARHYGLYSKIHTRKEEEWSLDLRSLSVGAAKTAFDDWMKTIREHEEEEEALPQTFSVYTGSSTHKFAQGLATAVASHLEQVGAPFRASDSQLGSFISSRDDLLSWLHTTMSSPDVAMHDGPCSPNHSSSSSEGFFFRNPNRSIEQGTGQGRIVAGEEERERERDQRGRRRDKMILAVLFSNSDGNILIERFHGVPAEERLHWRSFLVKLGADNLKGAKNEELLVASHKSVSIVYTMIGDVCLYIVGKDEYDELALAEVIFAITSAVKDVCGKPPTERLFLDKYGRICLCLDEIVWKGLLENTEKDRVRRLIRLKPPVEP
uniref:Smr domain-containing protein n=1 Tax=Oryza barthii TaxID=65489 RepID=A0A0D3FRK3_9ORYZ